MLVRPQFEFDNAYGNVYEWSEEHKSYFFCGKLNGATESEFIEEYYNWQ